MGGGSPLVSAEVLLKLAGGKSLKNPDILITAENVHLFKPSLEAVREAKKAFESMGFKVESFAMGISLVGPVKLFEEVFKVSLSVKEAGKSGKVKICPKGEPQIPVELKSIIEAVIFPPPPELFGWNDIKV